MAHKSEINFPFWRQLANPVVENATISAGAGWMAEDLRNNGYANNNVFFHQNISVVMAYNRLTNSWKRITSAFAAVGGTASGSVGKVVPSITPVGLLAAGGGVKTVVIATALPAALAHDQAKGARIRIIGKSAGGSGLVEERTVTGNSASATPTLTLDEPLSFAPAVNDGYEFLTGSYVLFCTGALAAGQFRAMDLLTGTLSSLGTTGCIATVPATGNIYEVMDEGLGAHDLNFGEGYLIGASTYDSGTYIKGCLLSTATGASTITGQAAAGDFGIPANLFRNKQIRIVEDAGTPTAVGQRARIVSHTGGAIAPVYTIQIVAGGWTVQPSAAAKYVIENWTDNIIVRFGGSATLYNYTIPNNYTGINTTNQWSTAVWAASGSAAQTTGAFGCYASGVKPDTVNGYVNNFIYMFRGATRTYDVFDPSGAATGAWTNGLSILNWDGTVSANDQLCHAYNPHSQDGRWLYFFPQAGSIGTIFPRPFFRFDCIGRGGESFAGIPAPTGTNSLGSKMAWISLHDSAAEKTALLNSINPLGATATEGTKFYQTELQI